MADPAVAPAPVNQNGDMSHRSGQMGPSGGPSSGQKMAKVIEHLPANALGALNTLTMPMLEKTVISGAQQVSKTVADQGSRVATNVISKLLKLILPRF